MKLLHIDSSPLGAASVSRDLTASLVASWTAKHPEIEVVYRDLAAAPIGHLTGETLQALMSRDSADLTDAQRREIALSEALIEEFLAADVLVVGAPMYNFSIPTQLKAWIDRIARAGRTFRYTENGPVGLAGGRKVVVASSRGGFYSTSEKMRALDHQEHYLATVFGFLGITDIEFVRAEGLGLGAEARSNAIRAAHEQIDHLAEAQAA